MRWRNKYSFQKFHVIYAHGCRKVKMMGEGERRGLRGRGMVGKGVGVGSWVIGKSILEWGRRMAVRMGRGRGKGDGENGQGGNGRGVGGS